MSSWGIARAKAQLSLLAADSRRQPQHITRRGKRVAVVFGTGEDGELAPAALEQARHPMRDFLRATSRLRDQGDLELKLPPRRAAR